MDGIGTKRDEPGEEVPRLLSRTDGGQPSPGGPRRRDHVERMRDHWWWRPDWRIGRRFYTWFLTFEGQGDVHRLARVYQHEFGDMPNLDLVPLEWLHLTVQEVGFTDEVSEEDVGRVASAAAVRCAGLEPFTVVLGPAWVALEGVVLDVAPAEPVHELREALRAAVAEVWSAGRGDRLLEVGKEFVPHVSLAYCNAAGPAAPLVEVVKGVSAQPASATVSAARLVVLSRDERVYRWNVFATAGLGAGGGGG